MPQTPIINDLNMFDTLSFSQKMQKSGMTEILANELAFSLRDMNVNHFDLLLTREEFQRFEKEIRNDFHNFEKEIHAEIEEVRDEVKEVRIEFKNEIEKLVTKTEFNTKIKNLELSITIKMGVIVTTGISVLAMMIKM
jgi:hypothetical protein